MVGCKRQERKKANKKDSSDSFNSSTVPANNSLITSNRHASKRPAILVVMAVRVKNKLPLDVAVVSVTGPSVVVAVGQVDVDVMVVVVAVAGLPLHLDISCAPTAGFSEAVGKVYNFKNVVLLCEICQHKSGSAASGPRCHGVTASRCVRTRNARGKRVRHHVGCVWPVCPCAG